MILSLVFMVDCLDRKYPPYAPEYLTYNHHDTDSKARSSCQYIIHVDQDIQMYLLQQVNI